MSTLSLPTPDSEALRVFVEAVRGRTRALRRKHRVLECERLVDEKGRESVLLRLRGLARNSLQLSLRLWDDRWCWFDARRGDTQGWQFTWSYDGRVSPGHTGVELVGALEQAHEFVWSDTINCQALEALWSPLLLRGPRA